MLALPSRHSSLTLLGTVVLAQVLLLAVQIKSQGQVRLMRVWTVGIISPFQRAGSWMVDRAHNTWSGYVWLKGAERENEVLRTEVERLKLRNANLEGRAAEADRLAGLLGFLQAHADVPMVPARVIGGSADTVSRTIYINRGEKDGLKRDLGVITPEGVVGKILEAYGHTSQVLLLTDKYGGVGALLANSRTQGSVGGLGEPLMQMKYVSNDEEVPLGERVLTSGQDRIFPKDLPVGTVADVKPGNPFKQIRVKPAAHLDRLEEVLVLLTQKEWEPSKAAEPFVGKGSAAPASPK